MEKITLKEVTAICVPYGDKSRWVGIYCVLVNASPEEINSAVEYINKQIEDGLKSIAILKEMKECYDSITVKDNENGRRNG